MKFSDIKNIAKPVPTTDFSFDAGPRGYVVLSDDTPTIHRGATGSIGDHLDSSKRVIPFDAVGSVSVGGNSKKYMTAKRAIGAGLTDGLGLLTPTRVRDALVIGLTSGEVIELMLEGKTPTRPEAIAMTLGIKGIEVV
jgi:hypothetical protein